MKVGSVLRMIIVLFFLGQYHTVAARPHISGRNRLLLCIGFPIVYALSLALHWLVCRCGEVTGSSAANGSETSKCARAGASVVVGGLFSTSQAAACAQ